ncbi:chemotaxis protein CheA [Nannocystaceae bacterium ST9]
MSESPEFVSEAQEIIESFSRQLLEIEGQIRDGDDYDPDLLNGSFRSVHTLKGLSALSGVNEIVDLSHKLENTLDALRLGKLPLNQRTLDLLFESVELFQSLLANVAEGDHGPVEIDKFLVRLAGLIDSPEDKGPDPLAWLDDSILGVLTEYEEHRLRENVRLGRRIFRVHASFDLLAIDKGIDALKQKLKNHGEVITYLPSADSTSEDRIELDILVGSKSTLAEIAEGIDEDGVSVETLGTGERVLIRKRAATAESGRSERAEAKSEPKPEPVKPKSTAARQAAAQQPSAPAKPTSASAEEPRRTKLSVEPVDEDDERGFAEAHPPADEAPRRRTGGGGSGGGGGGGGDDEVEGPGEGGDQLSLKSLSQTVRVDLRRLDHLMNLVGELALVHANLGGVVDRQQRADRSNEFVREFQDQLRIMNRRLGLLQQGILEVRMVPLGQVFDKLARVVRKLARELDKDVRLSISGADTELDKLIVEELSDPLMHMIRNAIDHGIEKPAERVALGKPRAGQVVLSAYQKGNRVVIELTDDGAGMDWRRLRDKAVERGFLTREESVDISPAQAVNLIFTPGFSTRDKVNELSGRGVGMDVVKTNISKLSGMIDVASEPGRGSRFRITLPITLAIIQALVIETAGQTFCIPLNSVLESIMVQSEEIHTIEGHEVVSVRGRTLPLIHLSRVFELEDSETREADRRMFYDRLYVVVVGLAQHRVGLVVDELLGQQDVVIKPIGKALRQVPGIAGATELGDNRTVLLIDVATLVSESVGGVEATVAGIGGGTREGIGIFSTLEVGGRAREHGGWGDGW